VQVLISSRKTDISDGLDEYTRDKIGRLDRYVDGIDYAEVHFREEQNPRIADKEVCEVTLEGHGHHVRCKVAAPDAFTAVDLAVNKLERQLRKLKTKLVNRWHQAGEPVPEGFDDEGGETVTEDPASSVEIIRTKSFALEAMTANEAALRLELVDHDFFFFKNLATDRAAVVYLRIDGGYGLIDDAG
jgi:putative sigma-54 modulation protein